MSSQAPIPDNGGSPGSGLSPTPVAEPIPTPTSEPATAQQLQAVERQMSGFERATLKWARLAFLISVLAAGFVCLQWWEMHTGGTDTHTLAEAAKTQAEKMQSVSDAANKISTAAEGMVKAEQRIADNAEKSLKASNDQSKAALDESIRAFRLEQRAWVGVSTHSITKFDESGVVAAIMLSNSGRTPARKVKVHVRTAAVNTVLDGPSKDDIKDLLAPPWEQKSDIPPEGRVILSIGELPAAQNFTVENRDLAEGLKLRFQAIKDGMLNVYYFGVVRYEDVSRQGHTTKFCLFIGDTKASPPSVHVCPEFNSMD